MTESGRNVGPTNNNQAVQAWCRLALHSALITSVVMRVYRRRYVYFIPYNASRIASWQKIARPTAFDLRNADNCFPGTRILSSPPSALIFYHRLQTHRYEGGKHRRLVERIEYIYLCVFYIVTNERKHWFLVWEKRERKKFFPLKSAQGMKEIV